MYHFVRNYVKTDPETVNPSPSQPKVSDELTSKKTTANTTLSTSISDTTSGTEIGSESLHTSSHSSCKVTQVSSDSSGNIQTSSQTSKKPSRKNPFEAFERIVNASSKDVEFSAQDTDKQGSLGRHDEDEIKRNVKIERSTVNTRSDKDFRGHSKGKHRPKGQRGCRLPSLRHSFEQLKFSSKLDTAPRPRSDGQVNLNTLRNEVKVEESVPVEPFVPAERNVYFEAEMFAEGKKVDAKFVRIEPNDEILIDVVDKTFQLKYKQMTMLMKTYYGTTLADPRRERIPQDKIQPGMVAVAFIYPRTVHAAFIRSKVLNLTQAECAGKSFQMVAVSGVDNGEMYIIPPQNLCYIDEEFLKVPFKMQQCKLEGLEFFHGTGVLKKMLRKFLNVDNTVKAIFSGSSGTVQVDLFARIQQHEQPVNLLLFQELMCRFTPSIPNDELIEVTLSHYEADGNVWVQVSHAVLPKILSFGSKVDEVKPKLQARSIDLIAEDILRGELHVVKSNESYYRANILEIFFDKNRAAVEFVDWGNRDVVPLDFVYRATDIDPNFGKLAPQALKIYIDCFKGFDLQEVIEGQVMYVRKISSKNQAATGVVSCSGHVLVGDDKIPLEAFVRQLTWTSRTRRHL